MADIEELVFKVGVEVDDAQLKRLRDEIKKQQDQAKNNAIKLGLSSSGTSSSTQSIPGLSATNFSQEIEASLKLSERHLFDILNILKTDHKKVNRPSEGDSFLSQNSQGPIPFVNDIMNQNLGSTIGGVIGGGVGALGGPAGAVAGAQIGSAIGGIGQKVLEFGKDKIEYAAKLFEERIREDIHFRQLSQQTGMLPEQLYKLGVAAKLAGTSLEEVVNSNQQLADELIGGIDDKKAQLLMALNINPRQALLESGGDVAKLNQTIFERAFKSTSNLPAYFQSSVLGLLGFGQGEQNARRYLYRGDVQGRAQQSLDLATRNGQVPFDTGAKLQKAILDFVGAQEDFKAVIRRALTTGNIAQVLTTKYMDIKAGTVNLIIKGIEDLNGLTQLTNPNVQKDIHQKTSVINETVDQNVRQREMIQRQLHHTPASASASVKTGAH